MEPHRVIGRYALFDAIAAGGMATVYYGVLVGPVGFARTVAVKQLHPRFSRDPDFVSMFADEARVTARIRHPNVVPVLDVVKHGRDLYIIMEYVLGVSLAWLLRHARDRGDPVPIDVAVSILCGCLEGLHGAHETRDEKGELRGIVHRDVSPGNVLVGRDGTARVLDFGIAKAVDRAQVTRTGEVKGKPSYMAPEQLRGGTVTRAADIHAVAVTLWEALVGTRAFGGPPLDVVQQRQRGKRIPRASELDPRLAPFDPIIERGLAVEPSDRWPTARAMADALRAVRAPAAPEAVAAWIEQQAGALLDERARKAASLEAGVSPTEIRAAIRADWNADTPMFQPPEQRGAEPTDRSGRGSVEPAADAVATGGAGNPDRDATPTRVEAAGPRAPDGAPAGPDQPAGAPALVAEEATAAAGRATSTRPSPIESTMAAARRLEEATTSPHGASSSADEDEIGTWPIDGTTTPAAPGSPLLARFGPRHRPAAAFALVALGVVALVALLLVLLGTPPRAPVPGPSPATGARSQPTEEPRTSTSAAAAPTVTATAAAPAPEPEPVAPPPAPRARRSGSAPAATTSPAPSAAASPPPVPSFGSDDPFDQLGGRH